MSNDKLNLGLMDDINNDDCRNKLDEWDNLVAEAFEQPEAKSNYEKKSQKLVQNSLDSIIDNNSFRNNFITNNSSTPNTSGHKSKKLFQNLGNFSFQKDLRIKIFGVGGAGNNMVRYMAQNSIIAHDSLYAINTDYQVLKTMPNDINVALIGDKITNGYGSGSDPEIGRKAAIESEEIIREMLEDTDLLFIVSGMGKGTGTGASPIIAKIAQDMGIMVLALVNLPSISNEGVTIYKRGQTGLNNLRKEVSGILTISNEKLFNETGANITLEKAFNYANSVISNVIYEIFNLITIPAQVNVDFNDVKTFFREPTSFQVNTFDFTSHDNIEEQINDQLQNLIYQDNIDGAKKAIVNFKLNPNINREIINNVTKALTKITKNNELEITIAIDYFENIECARISSLFAMNKLNEMSDNDVQVEPVKTRTIELDIINTRNEETEATLKTIELITNELSASEEDNNKNVEVNNNTWFKSSVDQNNSTNLNSFKDLLDDFQNLQKEINLNSSSPSEDNVSVKAEKEESNTQLKQDVRRSFIPTKKLSGLSDQQNNFKTIQFEHKTGPNNNF